MKIVLRFLLEGILRNFYKFLFVNQMDFCIVYKFYRNSLPNLLLKDEKSELKPVRKLVILTGNVSNFYLTPCLPCGPSVVHEGNSFLKSKSNSVGFLCK